ncbi:hypothetical protein NDU88_007655 [Pleurodeles waltl]|uniref:Uncharacterized protein n=1 Tax=Pleurodeles waltl TaxID=8319 RepID=A0AAV7PN83_PLEWA|nr:hypothetical protein NDU88_007655 [Pleurodeles waltl]
MPPGTLDSEGDMDAVMDRLTGAHMGSNSRVLRSFVDARPVGPHLLRGGGSCVPVSDRPLHPTGGGGQGVHTGTGGHRPPPPEGGGRAEAQPEQGTQGCLPAGTGRDTPRNGHSELLGKCAGWRRRRVTALGYPDCQGRVTGTWRHSTPLHFGRTAGWGASCWAAWPSLCWEGPLRNGRPASRTVPGGVEALCLKQQLRLAKQSIPKRTKCAQSIGVRCWLDPWVGTAVCSLGSQVQRRDQSDRAARRPRNPGPGGARSRITGLQGDPAYTIPSNPEEGDPAVRTGEPQPPWDSGEETESHERTRALPSGDREEEAGGACLVACTEWDVKRLGLAAGRYPLEARR